MVSAGGSLTKLGKAAIARGGTVVRAAAPVAVRAAPWVTRGAMAATGVGTGLLVGGAALSYYMSKQAGGGYVTPMAAGGMGRGNSPYLVGEQGPELFVPGTSGEIFNNKQTGDMLGSGKVVLKNVTIGIDSFGGLV